MRNRSAMTVWTSVCVIALATLAVARPSLGEQQSGEFDPRDFSGYWMGDTPRNNDPPPLTPAGRAMMEGRVPDYLTTLPNESNDPMYMCNPQGFPRLAWEENEPIEFIHTADKVIQHFQWERTLRELWIDGRELPSGENLENLGPTWYGHSVAEWEGDTLVVRTTGLDERAWIDEFANPTGFDALIEERYTRTGANTIEGLQETAAPEIYTAPWAHEPTIFTRMRPEDVSFFGWTGLFSGVTEAICAPMNELDEFNRRIRDPSLGLGN